ncbi:MAG: Calx-beta domain-containing protein [Geminicoccaceae bacterium]
MHCATQAIAADMQDANHPLNVAIEANGGSPTRFWLSNGQTVIGRIVRLDADTVTIRKPTGGVRVLAIDEIESVDIKTAHGEIVRSPLVVMADNSDAATDNRPIIEKEDKLAMQPMTAGQPESGGPLIKLADDPITKQKTSDNDQAKSAAVEITPLVPAASDIVATDPVRLTLSANPVHEGDAAAIFNLELSKASEKSIAIIYTLLDGTATASMDYTHRQGVLVIESGQVKAKIAAEIIDDTEVETNETLHLFVSGAPGTVVIENRKIEVEIHDDDG